MNPDTIQFWLSQLRPDHPVSVDQEYSSTIFNSVTVMVLCLTCILSCIALFCLYRHFSIARIYRAARRSLKSMVRQYYRNKNGQQLISDINALLKGIIKGMDLSSCPASLHGDKWLELLDRTGTTHAFTKGPGRVLGFHYHPRFLAPASVKQLEITVDNWLKKVAGHG